VYEKVAALAWSQFGAFSTAQVEGAGVHRSWVSRQVAKGSIVARAPAVYALAVAPRCARQDLMVHILAAGDGARATAASALGLWTPELVLPPRPEIAVPRTCGYRTDQAVVHRSRDLHLAKPGVIDGIPVVGVARALLDAAASRTPDEVLALIDACRRHSSLAVGALLEALETHARRGRPGIATFRTALRALRREVTDSEFERLVVRDLLAAGVAEPRLHHLVRFADAAPIELDLDWPGVLLDVELDGADHAVRVRRMRRDRQRDRILQSHGYTVARYTWDDYVDDRPGMLREIADLLVGARRDASTGHAALR
jgi:very-short-patch-repair endonuclease